MTTPEITILTPTFNRAHLLPRLYESLCKQTYKNFVWLIVDDGSTDGTKELVKSFQAENKINIEYHWHENVRKLISTIRAFKLIRTPYVFSVDSDDELPTNSIEILYNEMLKIKDNDEISGVIGRIQDQNKNIRGTDFPTNPFDSTWFLLVNKFKVLGPHKGMQKMKHINSIELDVEKYAGKGYIYDFWNYYLDAESTMRYINDAVYTYYLDPNDKSSLTNTKYSIKNAFGLAETSKHYLNAYSNKYFNKYPVPILKQLFKYIYYGRFSGDSHSYLMKELKGKKLKFFYVLLIIPVSFYSIIKPLK